jgi:TRAP-type C4-dicarboxylate transport system substrate-binding protein
MEVLKDFNYASYTANATLTNLWVVTFSVVMNKNKWNSLPSDVKKVIDDLAREQAFWTGHYVDNHVLESLTWSKEKYNLQIHELPAAEKAEIPKLLKPLTDGYIARVTKAGLPGEQIMKDVLYYKAWYEERIK